MDHLSGYGIGWGSLALINGGLAQGRSRSGMNWFWFSLVLAAIATFLPVAFFEELPGCR